MTEKKKRERVVAEITAVHLTQLVQALGRSLSRAEAIAFLNQEGRAYDMWKHMMHAGEAYIRSTLENQCRLVAGHRPAQTGSACDAESIGCELPQHYS